MADSYKPEVDNLVKINSKKFIDRLESEMAFKSDYTGELMAFDWLDEMEKACPHIDLIVRRAKVALIKEESIVKIERSRKVTVDSVKDLAKHTNNIDTFDEETNSVKPSKILDIRNEETFNIYENRFLYTLVDIMWRFILEKEDLLDNFEIKDNKLLEYTANTETKIEKVDIEIKVTSSSLPSSKIDEDMQEELKEIKKRIRRVKDYIASWQRSEMVKALDQAHVPFVSPPIKKTNIILKNPNFKIAVKLYEFLQKYGFEDRNDSKENLDENGNDVLRGFIDHSFLINYFVMDSMAASKREQKKKMARNATILLTQEIHRIVSLLLSTGFKITEEELLKLIAKEIKDEKQNRLVGAEDVKKKFKSAMDEYLERTQEYL